MSASVGNVGDPDGAVSCIVGHVGHDGHAGGVVSCCVGHVGHVGHVAAVVSCIVGHVGHAIGVVSGKVSTTVIHYRQYINTLIYVNRW